MWTKRVKNFLFSAKMKKDIQTATPKINFKVDSVLENIKTNFEITKPIPKTINSTVNLNTVFDNMKPIFDGESTFDKQLEVFFNKVAINDYEIKSRYELTCRKLEEIFQREVYNTCKVYNFGSTVTGLGFKNCDLDIYLDLGNILSNADIMKFCSNIEQLNKTNFTKCN